MRLVFFLLLVVFVSACRQRSEAYFHDRGRELLQELTLKLQRIDDIDSLMQQSEELEELFQSLVTVLIEAHKWQMKTKKPYRLTEEDQRCNQRLVGELNRLLRSPLMRHFLERIQQPALERLDAFEKKFGIQTDL